MENKIIDEIKEKIITLSNQHKESDDDLNDFELIELEAENLIIDYCVSQGYLLNGFPTEKKLIPLEELGDDYFCRERYQLYLDTLATLKEDVAELMWCYVSKFWEDQYTSKDEYIQSLKDNLESGVFYDVVI